MGRAPYAPSKAIIAIVTQHRRTPITKFDANVLNRQVGVTESLIPRTLVALQLLGFTDDDGVATPEFAALARVSDTDLKPALAEILTAAYEPVIASLGGSLANCTTEDLTGAFRSYNPLGQVDRMVQLFTGLMSYVDLMPETSRRAAKSSGGRSSRDSRPKGAAGQEAQREKRAPAPPPDVVHDEAPEYSRSIQLADGAGLITLSGTVNPFVLKGSTREFMFALLDLMDDYEITVEEDPDVHSRGGGDHA